MVLPPLFVRLRRGILATPSGTTRAQPSRSRSPAGPLLVEQLEERCLLSGLPSSVLVPVAGSGPYGLAGEAQLGAAPLGSPAVVFLGDSILAFYADGAGAAVWDATMARLPAADLAISGSRTETVLGQIASGQLNGLSPRVVVLMIGTNNLAGGQSPAEVAAEITACVDTLQAKLPAAKILLLGILPRGEDPTDPLREAVIQTNTLIAALGARPNVTYIDLGAAFLQPDGTLTPGVTLDFLHPSTLGYMILTVGLEEALAPLLPGDELLPGGSPIGSAVGDGSAVPAGTGNAASRAVAAGTEQVSAAIDTRVLVSAVFADSDEPLAPSAIPSLASVSTGARTLTGSEALPGTADSNPLLPSLWKNGDSGSLGADGGNPEMADDGEMLLDSPDGPGSGLPTGESLGEP